MDNTLISKFPANALAGPIMESSRGFVDVGSCMDKTGCTIDGVNRFKWLPIFPQGHLSQGQGFIGQRTCYWQGSQTQLVNALEQLYLTPWPMPYAWCADCLPIDIQWGAAGDERTCQTLGNIADANIGTELEAYNEYRISIVYQLLCLSDKWPPYGKPKHPQGTTLTLQVRGGGEILLVDPTAISDGGSGTGQANCFTGLEPAPGFYNSVVARMRIPLTEYHITCDRITDSQLCAIMGGMPWKCREQTVNCDRFMNEDEGTMLFDSWTLDRSFVPDVREPRRWRLGCVLKCRQVPGMTGPYPDNCTADCAGGDCYAIGWNHDYKRSFNFNTGQTGDLGWRFIMMRCGGNWTPQAASTPHGNCPDPYVPRFQYVTFSNLFCTGTTSVCTTGMLPGSDCGNDCDTETMYGCTSGEESIHGDANAALEDQIASIVDASRRSKANKAMRDQRLAASGEIEVWPKDTPPALADIMRQRDSEAKETIAKLQGNK